MKNLEEIVQGMRFHGTLTGAVYEYIGTAQGPFKDDRVSVYRREHSDALLYMNFKDFFGSIIKDDGSEVPRFQALIPSPETISSGETTNTEKNRIKGSEFRSVIEAHKQAKEKLEFFNRMMDEKNAKEKAKNPDSVTHQIPADGLPSEFSSSIYDTHDHENKAVIKTLEDQNPTGGLPFTVGHYAYYAGGVYQCFGAVTQADGQQVVLYKLKCSENVLYLPFNTFFSYVKVGNQMVPRFTCIDETPDCKMMA